MDCECEFMSGVPGETKFEGYGDGEVGNLLERLETARSVVSESLLTSEVKAIEPVLQSYVYGNTLVGVEEIPGYFYEMPMAELAKENTAIEKKLKELFKLRHSSYEPYAEYVRSFSSLGEITIDEFTNLEAKELQVASWLSGKGLDVHFRNPEKAKLLGELTSDCTIDKELFDIKRVESSNPGKIWSRVTEKKGKQGENFVVDLSMSDISLEDAMKECNALLVKGKASKIMLVINKKAYVMQKKNW